MRRRVTAQNHMVPVVPALRECALSFILPHHQSALRSFVREGSTSIVSSLSVLTLTKGGGSICGSTTQKRQLTVATLPLRALTVHHHISCL
eukprot:4090402-Amphidinium_carterae.1